MKFGETVLWSLTKNYEHFESGEGFTVFSVKGKAVRNPTARLYTEVFETFKRLVLNQPFTYRCSLGSGPINEFVFSPCGAYLAVVGSCSLLLKLFLLIIQR